MCGWCGCYRLELCVFTRFSQLNKSTKSFPFDLKDLGLLLYSIVLCCHPISWFQILSICKCLQVYMPRLTCPLKSRAGQPANPPPLCFPTPHKNLPLAHLLSQWQHCSSSYLDENILQSPWTLSYSTSNPSSNLIGSIFQIHPIIQNSSTNHHFHSCPLSKSLSFLTWIIVIAFLQVFLPPSLPCIVCLQHIIQSGLLYKY